MTDSQRDDLLSNISKRLVNLERAVERMAGELHQFRADSWFREVKQTVNETKQLAAGIKAKIDRR